MAQGIPQTAHGPTPDDDVPDAAVVETTAGGGLVYDVQTEYSPILDRETEVERTLIGFVHVTDWQAIRDELRSRGHGTGASRHLPELTGSSYTNAQS